MIPSALGYQVSREWMEAEILAGRPIQHRRQTLSVDLEDLENEQAQRVEAVLDAVQVNPDSGRVTVLDSGIDPEKKFGPEDKRVPMDTSIIQVIGRLPELPKPTDDLHEVLTAWEEWLDRYCSEALQVIETLNLECPKGENSLGKEIQWGGIRIALGPAVETVVKPEDGSKAMQNARAAWAWTWAAKDRFGRESVEAAKEATTLPTDVGRKWVEVPDREQVAQFFHERAKKMHATAKAHDAARRDREPDFDAEMVKWASKKGSTRLQLGIEDGYRMNARYLAERLAVEAPGFFAMPANSAKKDWARRTASPSEQALRLRRHVEAAIRKAASESPEGPPDVEILTVTEPPPQMYLAHGDDFADTDLPSKEGWPWWYDENNSPYGYDAKPFEAIVVKNWLGRFHLVGAVSNEAGIGPAGIWAVPQLGHFEDDGSVHPQNPDDPPPKAAKRKPPRPGEDDIPF